MEFQVRSTYEIKFYETIIDCLNFAKTDKSVWKISFKSLKDGLYYRFIRDDNINSNVWIQQPISDYLSDKYAPYKIWTEKEMIDTF
jgi:hypothetical protein